MRMYLPLLLCLSTLGACADWKLVDDGGTPTSDSKCPSLPDLYQAPPARCAAAQGLSGDILSGLCVDMETTDAAALSKLGFNLGAAMVNCLGWEVVNSKLSPKNINTSAGAVTCALSLPAIAIDAKYSRVTLALVQQGTIPGTGQQITIALPAATPKPLWVWVESNTSVDQRTIIDIPKNTIPPPAGAPFQPAIQLYAPGTTTTPSWAIASIAVLGNP